MVAIGALVGVPPARIRDARKKSLRPKSAAGGLHLRFFIFAILTCIFRHTHALTNQHQQSGGQSHCFEMCSQSVTAMYWNPLAVRDCDALKCVRASRASTWYVARCRDARQWNSLVNTKQKR